MIPIAPLILNLILNLNLNLNLDLDLNLPPAPPQVRLGADVLASNRFDLLRGKRVGLITNHSGRLSTGEFLLDTLIASGIRVTALFGPEHGIRGEAQAGVIVADSVDAKTGIPAYSLYGAIRKPTPAMLKNVDLLVYDIQDVGARFYTYISTMALCMEAAAEQGIDFVVLDRPNPLGGLIIDGPILPDSLRSFVGYLPVPVAYGLTIGELATMANEEGWLAGHVKAQLTVVPLEGWKRRMKWRDTGLPWIPPSPNIRTPEAALLYPGTCLVEATNFSEGRGTDAPFQLIGAPFVDRIHLSRTLNDTPLEAVTVRETTFTPTASKHRGRSCTGLFISPWDSGQFSPVVNGIELLSLLRDAAPDSFNIRPPSLRRLLGDPEAVSLIQTRTKPESITSRWAADLKRFRALSRRYWQYPE